MKKTVAVLTPAYNRAYIIDTLYQSLKNQSSFDFKWYVIDDGSSDSTDEFFSKISEDNFEIFYVKKENGGKHTAVNYAMNFIEEELTFIVDSDDYLSENAIETIVNDWSLYKSYGNICGLSYYKANTSGEVIGDKYPGENTEVASFIDYRINRKVSGDKAEVYCTDVLKKFPFPEFKGEKFIGEGVVWKRISHSGYKLAFIPKTVYYCEYRNDGLTSMGRKKQLDCPLGTIEGAKAYLYPEIKFSIRLKYMCMLIAVTRYSGIKISDALKDTKCFILSAICYIPGILLGKLWKNKYRK